MCGTRFGSARCRGARSAAPEQLHEKTAGIKNKVEVQRGISK
jgi:hypothetical protein